MPRGDRTGPNGMGPRTGRGAGFCAGNQHPGFQSRPGGGYGRGYGRGGGRGWLRSLPGWLRVADRYLADREARQSTAERVELQQLRDELARANARLEALENQKKQP